MTIVVYTAAATEPLTVAEVAAHLRLDASNNEPAPGLITVALASPAVAGNVTAGAHRYLATFVTADGETEAGQISAAVTVADAAVNGKIELTGIPIGGALVTSRKIYRTAAGGTAYLLLATIANNTATTYTDNIADASLGAGAPTTNTTGDPLISALISAARAAAEQELHRYLITQTLDAYFDSFPCVGRMVIGSRYPEQIPNEFRLPPLQSVTSITYVDTAGATQTLAADQYTVDTKSQPARITPAYGVSWPATREQANAVTVRFVAGYGAASAVPDIIKLWMKNEIKKAHPSTANETQIDRIYSDAWLDSERVTGRI